MPPRHLRPLAVLALCALASPPALAQGDLLYTVTSADGMLRLVDPWTATTIGSTQITTSTPATAVLCNGLARDPVSGALYVILREATGGPRKLAVLDPATAFAVVLGPLADNFAALAVRADGVLFGVTGDGATTPETLWTIDPSTQVATLVLPLGNGNDGESIAFAPDGFLYHASGLGQPNVNEVFERIDTAANTVTTLTLSGFDYGEMLSMTSYAGGNLLAADLYDNLMLITTGAHVSLLGQLDHSYVKGLAYVPSPTTQAFFRAYGAGCAASSGAIPALAWAGTPSPGASIQLHVLLAPASSFGVLLIGVGTGAIPLPSQACQAQINPIAPGAVGFVVSPAGAFTLNLRLPAGLGPSDFYLQTGHVDGNAFVVGNPLQLHVR